MVIESNGCSSAECVGDQLLGKSWFVQAYAHKGGSESGWTAHGFPKKNHPKCPAQNVTTPQLRSWRCSCAMILPGGWGQGPTVVVNLLAISPQEQSVDFVTGWHKVGFFRSRANKVLSWKRSPQIIQILSLSWGMVLGPMLTSQFPHISRMFWWIVKQQFLDNRDPNRIGFNHPEFLS